MKDKKSIATIRDFYTMPLLASFVLFVGLYGLLYLTGEDSNNFIHFGGGYDLGFILAAGYIVGNHILAFSIVPLLALRKEITKESRTLFITFAIITIIVQLTIRLLSIGTSHLDCGSQCGNSIIPIELDFHLFIFTAIGLVAAFILFLGAFNKKLARTET